MRTIPTLLAAAVIAMGTTVLVAPLAHAIGGVEQCKQEAAQSQTGFDPWFSWCAIAGAARQSVRNAVSSLSVRHQNRVDSAVETLTSDDEGFCQEPFVAVPAETQ